MGKKPECFEKNKKLLQIGITVVILGLVIGLTIGGIFIYDDYLREHAIPAHSDAACFYSLAIWHTEEKNQLMCKEKGCVWIPEKGGPSCYFPPPSTHGYLKDDAQKADEVGVSTSLISLKPTSAKVVEGMIENLEVEMTTYSENIFRIKVKAAGGIRYEVPVPLNLPAPDELDNTAYNVSLFDEDDDFAIKVTRASTGTVIFDTGIGGFTFADQFLQIATKLPTSNLYGLGENTHMSLKHDLNYATWPMFARDQPPGAAGQNLYGVHPMYMLVEGDGSSHAIFWLNSNAMEAETMPTPGLTLRSIGGIMDLLFFMGPSPQEVIQQYTEVVGRPFLPPYWSLGFQLCRYGYNSLDNMKAAVSRTRRHGIPLDVQYADIDHFDRRLDFTYDNESFGGLPDYIDQLKEDGIHFIIILDPAINAELDGDEYPVHERAMNKSVYIEWPEDQIPDSNFESGAVMLGYVWPDNRTAFPDFFKSSTRDWWTNEILLHYSTLKFDGLWIDMNEPANFGTNEEKPWNWPEGWEPWSLHCPNSTFDDPPYATAAASIWGLDKRLSEKTLCMSGVQGENNVYRHYDVHNLYGWSETEPTLRALQNATSKRGIVVTRSTFPSSGQWAGHWLGDNTAAWEHMHQSIIGMIEFNFFGIPYIGADICGFFGDSTEEMCERWMELGAFYPYSRNHNTLGARDHDPGLWPSVAASSHAAMKVRYTLLPYLYTLHHLASTEGHTVIRPLFFEFPESINAQDVDTQFLWGSWLMITPVLEEGMTSRRSYFPEGVWFDYYTGLPFVQNTGSSRVIPAPRSHIPVFVRGGGILPTQRPRANTVLSRNEPLGLIVAPDLKQNATGTFYWDEGDSIDPITNTKYFKADMLYVNGTLTWKVTQPWDGVKDMRLSDIKIFNVPTRPTQLMVNDSRWKMGDWHYHSNSKVLELFDLEIPVNNDFKLTWNSNLDFRIPCPISYSGWNETVDTTEDMCSERNCIWDDGHEVKCAIPLPSDYGYEYHNGSVIQTEKGFRLFLNKRGASLYGSDASSVTFEVFLYSDDTFRFKFYDTSNERYEVPIDLNLPSTGADNPMYEVVYPEPVKGSIFYFYVVRKETGNILFDTRIGGLTFSDQFLSLTTLLPSKNIYGLGENTHHSFRHDLNQKTWPIFARDQPPVVDEEERNLYGAHPYYQCVENDGKTHGVLLINSNAMDYQMLDYPAISYRTIGGVLDFYMMLGPEPESVVSQYTSLIHRPMMPPYWALGFQLCRYGYESLEQLQEAVNRTRESGIPQDVQYGDIDYMDRRMSFTYDEERYNGFPEYISEVKVDGLRFIVILDPAINAEMPTGEYKTHERAAAADVYVKWANDTNQADVEFNNGGNSSYMLGYVWPENKTAFPSFFKKAAHDWWMLEITDFYESIPFDGLWIDMNEPANFGTNEDAPWNWPADWEDWSLKCPNSRWDDPPYVTKAGSWSAANRMADKTLCLAGVQERDGSLSPYRHYDVHNLYGWSQTQPTYLATQDATGKRSLVISRSTFPGSGQWTGHWLGDNKSIWPDMKRSIIGMLEFNLFGIPYVGADICGFFGNTTESLCQRWMELGAFYPYSRNHNSKDSVDQDPGSMSSEVVESSKKALEARYRLLPYLYTLFYHAHTQGNTVIRALLHEFPSDRQTLSLDDQFLWGSALMISPILEEDQVEREIYFPYDAWYDYYTGKPVEWIGDRTTVEAPLDTIPLHIRGGYILPTQKPAMNTQQSREEAMGIIVAIGLDRRAIGHLFWDDGDSQSSVEKNNYSMVHFSFVQDKLTITVNNESNKLAGLKLTNLEFLGVELEPDSILYNQEPHTNFTYDPTSLKLTVTLDHDLETGLELKLNEIWYNTVVM